MKCIARAIHSTYGKKKVLMVLGRSLNVFGIVSDFVDDYSYRVC